MIFKAFTFHDSKAELYTPPFFQSTEAQAQRTFSDMINGDHVFAKNPADYTLFIIGQYDDNTGELVPSAPRSLGNGVDFKR